MNRTKLCILFLFLSVCVVGCFAPEDDLPPRCPILAPVYGATRTLGTMPVVLDWSYDGKQVIHGVHNHERTSGLFLADIDQKTTSSLAISDSRIEKVLSAEFSPRTDQILIESEKDDVHSIFVLDGKDYSVQQVVGQGYFPQWSPDGAKISFRKYPPDGVWVISTTNRQNNIVVEFEVPTYFWFSQNGFWHPIDDKILMGKSGDVRNEPDDLAVLDLSTSEITHLTNSSDCEWDAKWSPQRGEKVAYMGAPTGYWDIFLMNADDRDTKNLTHSLSGHVVDYNWSPDGKTIVFTSLNPIDYDLYHQDLFLLDIETEEIQQLTSTDGADEFEPVWSPDGNRIAYFVERPSLAGWEQNTYELYVFDLSSGNSELLNKIEW